MIPNLHPPSSRRRDIMLCHPFEEKRLLKWGPGPWLIQPKLDGERCRAIVNPNGSVVLLSSEAHLITSVPHIVRALEDAHLPPGLELDGELYTHGQPFDSGRSIVSRTVNLHPDHEKQEYHIFDVVNELPQYSRTRYLVTELSHLVSPPIRTVPSTPVYSIDEILAASNEFIDAGYEGFILRHLDAPYERKRSLWIMKFKPRQWDIYSIIGWKEERDKYGDPKGRLGALTCTSDEGTIFDVGSGFTALERELLWKDRDTLKGQCVQVKYQSINPSGAPRFPIFSRIFDPLKPEDWIED